MVLRRVSERVAGWGVKVAAGGRHSPTHRPREHMALLHQWLGPGNTNKRVLGGVVPGIVPSQYYPSAGTPGPPGPPHTCSSHLTSTLAPPIWTPYDRFETDQGDPRGRIHHGTGYHCRTGNTPTVWHCQPAPHCPAVDPCSSLSILEPGVSWSLEYPGAWSMLRPGVY